MTTYYVDGAVGNDANAGTAEGAGNAWATIAKALATVIAGDEVWIKASATYTGTAAVSTPGTLASPISLRGYSTTPGDNGKITWDGTGQTTCLSDAGTSLRYLYYENMKFENANSYGCYMVNADALVFFNCEFNNNGSMGIWCDNNATFVNCVASNNGNQGVNAGTGLIALGNLFHTNVNEQVFAGSIFTFYRNACYGGSGAQEVIDVGSGVIIGNTIDGENVQTVGVRIPVSSNNLVVDNIIYDVTTGIDQSSSWNMYTNWYGNNLFFSNTTNMSQASRYSNTQIAGYGDVESDPLFTNEAGDNYTLSATSPAIDAGIHPGGIT